MDQRDQWDRAERAAQGKRHAERLAAAGLTTRMACEVEWVLDAGSGDEVLAEAFGPELADTVVAVRRAEIERFVEAKPEEIVTASRWLP